MHNNSQIKDFSKHLIEKMFQVRKGECVAITADSGSDKALIFAIAEAAENAGGKSLLMFVPRSEYDGEVGMKVWPHEALTAALCEVDVWIDTGGAVMLYSEIWETAMAKNKRLRYLVIGDTDFEALVRTFMDYDIPTLKALLVRVQEMAMAARQVRISAANGTDLTYEINPNYAFDYDDGDFSEPIFGTPPGYVNIVPKKGSMNGVIVFDDLMIPNISNDIPIGFVMQDGRIADVTGNGDTEKVKQYLAGFDDPNMYKISHNMLGLHPNIRVLSGNITEDERIWGGADFGFGHTSPMDMPPDGQPAKSHFDGVVCGVSVWLDEVQIFDNGEICHADLVPLVEKLL